MDKDFAVKVVVLSFLVANTVSGLNQGQYHVPPGAIYHNQAELLPQIQQGSISDLYNKEGGQSANNIQDMLPPVNQKSSIPGLSWEDVNSHFQRVHPVQNKFGHAIYMKKPSGKSNAQGPETQSAPDNEPLSGHVNAWQHSLPSYHPDSISHTPHFTKIDNINFRPYPAKPIVDDIHKWQYQILPELQKIPYPKLDFKYEDHLGWDNKQNGIPDIPEWDDRDNRIPRPPNNNRNPQIQEVSGNDDSSNSTNAMMMDPMIMMLMRQLDMKAAVDVERSFDRLLTVSAENLTTSAEPRTEPTTTTTTTSTPTTTPVPTEATTLTSSPLTSTNNSDLSRTNSTNSIPRRLVFRQEMQIHLAHLMEELQNQQLRNSESVYNITPMSDLLGIVPVSVDSLTNSPGINISRSVDSDGWTPASDGVLNRQIDDALVPQIVNDAILTTTGRTPCNRSQRVRRPTNRQMVESTTRRFGSRRANRFRSNVMDLDMMMPQRQEKLDTKGAIMKSKAAFKHSVKDLAAGTLHAFKAVGQFLAPVLMIVKGLLNEPETEEIEMAWPNRS